MASYFNSVGSKVTVIEMLPKIAGANDNEISEILLNSYTKKGIDFKLGAKVLSIYVFFLNFKTSLAYKRCFSGSDGASITI